MYARTRVRGVGFSTGVVGKTNSQWATGVGSRGGRKTDTSLIVGCGGETRSATRFGEIGFLVV